MPSSVTLTFVDAYEYQRSVRTWDVRVFVTTRGEFEAKLTKIDLHRLWMKRGWLSPPFVAYKAVHKTRNAIFFLTEAQQAPILYGGVEISPGDIVFGPPGHESHLRSSASCHWGGASLTPDDLATSARALVGHDQMAPAVTRVVRPHPPLMSRLLSLHKAVDALAATAPDILAHPEVAKAVEQEMVRAMIACLTDPDAVESSGSSRQRLPTMRRFEQLLEAHPNQPLYVTEICAAIGVTDRTLRMHCQEHLGISPRRYLWLRRISLARRALALADGAARTVTEIANDHGFGELGRFAVSYRKLFGESPSTTLRRPPDELPRIVLW